MSDRLTRARPRHSHRGRQETCMDISRNSIAEPLTSENTECLQGVECRRHRNNCCVRPPPSSRRLTAAGAGEAPTMVDTDPEQAGRSRFERLAMPHRNAAYNLAYWMLRSRDEAEDVVQEAYLRAFRAFPTFKGDAIKPWLLVIVRNACYSALGARKRNNNVILLSDDLKARRGVEAPE